VYLSYSGYQSAKSCRLKYWHSYINKTSLAKPEDRLGSIYGTAVGRLFEAFYRDALWKQPGARAVLLGMVESTVDAVLQEEQSPDPKKNRQAGTIVWRENLYASRDALVADVLAAIPRGLATIKTHLLIGKVVHAELKLDSDIEGHRVGGRADFVMQRIPPHGDLVIIDGKGSRKRDRYTDELQLQWYAMLYREKFGRLPDKTAFVYWHFDPPSNIDWRCNCGETDIDDLKTNVIRFMNDLEAAAKKVEARALPIARAVFPPSPGISNCRFCPYATPEACPEGFAVVAKAKGPEDKRWQA
jgi:hypothetical protein